jgi:TPR repeat protein
MRLILACLCGLSAGCSRDRSLERERAAPSASVITIGVALGTCADISVCENECDAGSPDRCRRLAATFALGQGVDKDEARATALYEQACEMKDPSACVFSGQMNEFARGVAKDDAKAARFYERACDLQWGPGCYNLGIMYERGTGEPHDRAKAGDLYQVACTAGVSQSCDKVKEMRMPAPIPFLDGGF